MIIEGDKFRNKNQKTRINIISKKWDDTQKVQIEYDRHNRLNKRVNGTQNV